MSVKLMNPFAASPRLAPMVLYRLVGFQSQKFSEAMFVIQVGILQQFSWLAETW